MALRHRGSIRSVLIGAVCALAGCSTPAALTRPGELEVSLGAAGSYDLIGRFHVDALEPWSPSRDIELDPSTSSARIELPAGSFSLTLAAGARVVCAGEDREPFAGGTSAAPRLVWAAPQVLWITPGELTTARIRFGAPRELPAAGTLSAATSYPLDLLDPCSWCVDEAGGRSRRRDASRAWHPCA